MMDRTLLILVLLRIEITLVLQYGILLYVTILMVLTLTITLTFTLRWGRLLMIMLFLYVTILLGQGTLLIGVEIMRILLLSSLLRLLTKLSCGRSLVLYFLVLTVTIRAILRMGCILTARRIMMILTLMRRHGRITVGRIIVRCSHIGRLVTALLIMIYLHVGGASIVLIDYHILERAQRRLRSTTVGTSRWRNLILMTFR